MGTAWQGAQGRSDGRATSDLFEGETGGETELKQIRGNLNPACLKAKPEWLPLDEVVKD